MIDIAAALTSLRPGSTWIVHDEDYSTLQWLDETTVPPTEEEIQTELARLQVEYNKLEYQRNRKPEYPPLADLADAVYWQSQGDDTKMSAYIAAVNAVKSKYPKE